MRISDWSSDVCSSDLRGGDPPICQCLDQRVVIDEITPPDVYQDQGWAGASQKVAIDDTPGGLGRGTAQQQEIALCAPLRNAFDTPCPLFKIRRQGAPVPVDHRHKTERTSRRDR